MKSVLVVHSEQVKSLKDALKHDSIHHNVKSVSKDCVVLSYRDTLLQGEVALISWIVLNITELENEAHQVCDVEETANQTLDAEAVSPALPDWFNEFSTCFSQSDHCIQLKAQALRCEKFHYDDKIVTADLCFGPSNTSALTQQLWESQSDPVNSVPFTSEYIGIRDADGHVVGCLFSMSLNVTVIKPRIGMTNTLICNLQTRSSSIKGCLSCLEGDIADVNRTITVLTVQCPVKVLKSIELSTYLVDDDSIFVKISNVTNIYDVIIDSVNTRSTPLHEDMFPLTLPVGSQYMLSIPMVLVRAVNSAETRRWNNSDHKTVVTLAIQWHTDNSCPSWTQHAADCKSIVSTPLQMTLLTDQSKKDLKIGSQVITEAIIQNFESEPVELVLLCPDVDDDLSRLLAICAPVRWRYFSFCLEHWQSIRNS